MIIHLDGKAEELLEFVKGMQFTIAACTSTDDLDADRKEVELEVEKMFTEHTEETEGRAELNRKLREVSFEPSVGMMMWLHEQAHQRRVTVSEFVNEIVREAMIRG